MANALRESDVAIVGMSCRFPGADTVEAFWKNLCAGTESITFFSDEELLEAGVPPSLLANPNYVKAAPVLHDADMFDAAFFGLSPKEAALMDPQHRLFLEVAEDNAAARALYATAGFAEAGRRRGYYAAADGGRRDALLLALDLTVTLP